MNKLEKARAAKAKEIKVIPLKAFEERMVRHFEKQRVMMVRIKDSSNHIGKLGRYYGINYRELNLVFFKWFEPELIKCARENECLKPSERVEGFKG